MHDFAAAFAAQQQPVRYAADKQTIESLLKNVREDPYDGLNHGVLADSLDEVYGEHPLHEFIRAHGLNGAETPNFWHEAYQAGYDGTFAGYVPVGEKNGFRFLLGHEGGSRNSNGRWTVFAQPWKVKNRQLRDDAYAMEFKNSGELKNFADAAGLPAIHPHAETDPDTFIARHEHYYEGRPQQLQRREQPVRYAKSKRRRVHPLLRGTRLAVVLKEIAADSTRPQTAAFAKGILYDEHGPTRFGPFSDHLEETQHPLFSHYNWHRVTHRLTHDDALLGEVKRIVREHRQQSRRYGQQLLPRLNQTIGTVALLRDGYLPESRDRVTAAVRAVDPDATDAHVRQSLHRVLDRLDRVQARRDPDRSDFFRATAVQRDRDAALRSHEEQAAHIRRTNSSPRLRDPSGADDERIAETTRRQLEQEEALRYSQQRVGGVKNALRLMQGRGQSQYRRIAADVLQRLRLQPARVRDGVTLSGAPVSSVVAAIYHGGDEGRAEAAAAYFGHLMQLPAVTTFHAAADGPDSLYKLTLPLAPAAAAQHLQRHGVSRAVLVPRRNATDVLIHDPGRRQADRVAAAAQDSEVQETVGRSVRLGSSGGHRADSNSRRAYRHVIQQFEDATSGSRQQPAAAPGSADLHENPAKFARLPPGAIRTADLKPWVAAMKASPTDRVTSGAFADYLEERGGFHSQADLDRLRSHEGPLFVTRHPTSKKVVAVPGTPVNTPAALHRLLGGFPWHPEADAMTGRIFHGPAGIYRVSDGRIMRYVLPPGYDAVTAIHTDVYVPLADRSNLEHFAQRLAFGD